MNKEVLYDWIFHFNPYMDLWEAVNRDNFHELFSGDQGNVFRSKSPDTLVEMILKTDGEPSKIKTI